MTKQEIGAILMQLREKSGKSREEVADLLGKSVKTVGHWETGYAQPDANTLFLLCTIYDADLNTSFGFPSANKKNTPLYSSEAMKLAADYDKLDGYGQRMLRLVADEEKARCDEQARSSPSTTKLYIAARDGSRIETEIEGKLTIPDESDEIP